MSVPGLCKFLKGNKKKKKKICKINVWSLVVNIKQFLGKRTCIWLSPRTNIHPVCIFVLGLSQI